MSHRPSIQTGFADRARVLALHTEGLVSVAIAGNNNEPIPCEVLQTAAGKPLLAPGDEVLVWFSPSGDELRGVIMGRIGPSNARIPDEMVLEARHNLVIRCGEGAITLRGDGKVLIQGKDLVSRARRLNRIKGGAVALN